MKILITGTSGFLGGQIEEFFLNHDIRIASLNRCSGTYQCDFSREVPSISEDFDTVIHAAGIAHRTAKSELRQIRKVNFEGTKNLCLAFERAGKLPQNFVFISSVSVYGRVEGENISEHEPLNGCTSYARSKIEAENWLIEWANSNHLKLIIFRLPLIAGPNPPGNLGAMIRGIKTGRYFRIGSGKWRKSVVLSADVADIIAKSIGRTGVYNLTDGYHPSVYELENTIASQLNRRPPRSIPLNWAKLLGKVGDLIGERSPLSTEKLEKITNTLTFCDDKARIELGWSPNRVIDRFKIL